MADFNSNYHWNGADDAGFNWNGARYVVLKKAYDTTTFNESEPVLSARIMMRYLLGLIEEVAVTRECALDDDFSFVDKMDNLGILFEHFEEIGMGEEITEFIANLFISDNIPLLEEISTAISLEEDDSFFFEDFFELLAYYEQEETVIAHDVDRLLTAYLEREDAFSFDDNDIGLDANLEFDDDTLLDESLYLLANLELPDDMSYEDMIDLAAYLSLNENVGITDYKPKVGTTDWLIGYVKSNIDQAVDWLIPFKLMVDWGSTEMPRMPESILTTVELPYTDGSIVENAVYKDRTFKIVGFSKDGLTDAQKGNLIAEIDELLDSIKFKDKELTIQERDITFDVRYEGLADIQEGPSYVKATIPFRATPYGHDLFDGDLDGSGLIDNTIGAAPLGVVVYIKGPVTDPSFTIDGKEFKWTGSISKSQTLVIDNNLMSVYIIEPNGKKTNALKDFTGTFYRVPKQTSVVMTVPDEIKKNVRTKWNVKRLW